MKYGKITTIALITTTVLASSLMASVNARSKRVRGHQLDPMIIEIIDRAETGTMAGFEINSENELPQRVLNRSMKPPIGVRRDNTRLQIKFIDELQIRLDEEGNLYSRTNRSTDAIAGIIEGLELTFTACVRRSQEDIDALMVRARRHARKQTPDLGGMYWIDGNVHNVALAATALHALNDVEYVFWNTIFVPEKHTSEFPSIFSDLSVQNGNEMLAKQEKLLTLQVFGACLFSPDVCEAPISESDCVAFGGSFLGENSICPDDAPNNDERGIDPINGACCFILMTAAPPAATPPPTGGLFVAACLDSVNDAINKATCQVIAAPGLGFASNTYLANVNSNGVWYSGSICTDIVAECIITGTLPPGAFACGETGDPDTSWSGDCYHDQSDPALYWTNRAGAANPLAAPIGFAPGCWDAPFFPLFSPSGLEPQTCCAQISAIDALCGNTLWDAECAGYANDPEFTTIAPVACFNSLGLGDPAGFCSSPWGPNHRPFPVNPGGPFGTQRMVVITAGPTITDVTVPATGGPYGCGWSVPAPGADPIIPGQPNIGGLPVAAGVATPDYGALGIITHITDERIAVGFPAAQLLQWPMCGAQVGDATNNTAFGTPVISPRGDSRWVGNGLNLFADGAIAPVGIGNGAQFSGLYGLGFRRQNELGVPNGTHGSGVRVAVLDYAAYIQTYTDTAGNILGGLHEDLAAVLLEGPATGHDALQMIFNPPDAPDFPFNFPQSPSHGTAQLGVIAASWNQNPNNNGTPPPANIGAVGLAPDATVAFYPLMDLESLSDGTGGRVVTAWFNAMEWLRFGDVLSAGYIGLDNWADFPNHSFNPEVNTLMETANDLGVIVVIPAGDSGVDLSESEFPNEIDPGHISVCAITPGGAPAKRWSDTVIGSSFVAGNIDTARNTCAAWGAGVVTCGMGPAQDNWLGYKTITYTNALNPVEVQGRSYTNNYSGTSAAAAIVAGLAADMQGYAIQVFTTPLAPMLMRQYAAHGQILGTNPDTGALLLSILNAGQTASNVASQTENDTTTTAWPSGAGTLGCDLTPAANGEGNIVGYAIDPRYACIRMTVDPLFENPNVDNVLFIRGDFIEGTNNAIAAQDGIFMAASSVHTPIGEYTTPSNVPGSSVQYNFAGETTDLYFNGIATDPRGNTLLTLHNITVNVAVAPMQAPTTMMQLWMWDFTINAWIQPSVTVALATGDIAAAFEIVRAQNLLNTTGRYHARLVTISGSGPFSRFPVYYDQVRMNATIPTTSP